MQRTAKGRGCNVLAELFAQELQADRLAALGFFHRFDAVRPRPKPVPCEIVDGGNRDGKGQRYVGALIGGLNTGKQILMPEMQYGEVDYRATGTDDAEFEVAVTLDPTQSPQHKAAEWRFFGHHV